MVVHNFHVCWPRICPAETDAVLIINTNTLLSLSISLQGFQAVSWRNPKFVQRNYGVKLIKLAGGNLPQRLWACASGGPCAPAVEDILCTHVLEGLDHGETIAWNVCPLKPNVPRAMQWLVLPGGCSGELPCRAKARPTGDTAL